MNSFKDIDTQYNQRDKCLSVGMDKCYACKENNRYMECLIEFFSFDVIKLNNENLLNYIFEEAEYEKDMDMISMPYLFRTLEIYNKSYIIKKYNYMRAFL